MDRILSDLKFVFRSLIRTPLFTAVAVFSLALGIGANSAIFSLLDQVLLRSLPVKDPAQLVSLNWKGAFSGRSFGDNDFSYPSYLGLRDNTGAVFSGVLARFGTAVDLGYKGVAERTNGELVSGNYFQVLGVGTAIGRTITPAEDGVKDGSPYVVLSYAYWQKRFGGNPGILNTTVEVNSHPMTVIGIAQSGFRGTDAGTPADVFVPMAMETAVTPTRDDRDNRASVWLDVLARRKPGVSLAQAQADASVAFRQQLQEDLKVTPNPSPRFHQAYLKNKFWLTDAARGLSSIREQFSTPLIVLMTMVGTLLLIACGNVANLLVARAAAREKEIAVRISLGARTGAILRIVLIESLVLSFAGGALALLVASWSSSLLLAVLPFDTFAMVISTRPDLRIIAFTLGLSAVTAILFGLTPALQMLKPDLVTTLKGESRSVVSGPQRFRKGMVAAQIALSLLLLIGAGLFARSLANLMSTATGMQTDHVLSFSVDPSLSGYSDSRSRQLFAQIQKKLEAIPGAHAASGVEDSLLSQNDESRTTSVEGYVPNQDENMNPEVNHALPGLFASLGVPLISGREFSERDLFGAPKVAIINQTFAKKYFGHRNPLGSHIGFNRAGRGKLDMQVVGVIADTKIIDLKKQADRQVWTAALQDEGLSSITFYIRTYADPKAMASIVRRTVAQIDPRLPVYDLKTLETQIDETQYVDRLIGWLAAAFGIVATLLASIGLYGVMAFTVARRTPEIGIRMALGAQRPSVLRMIMLEVALLIAIGIGVALPLALGLGHYLQNQLFQVKPNDPATLAFATASLVLVALVAGYIPAVRATRIDPMVALRWE